MTRYEDLSAAIQSKEEQAMAIELSIAFARLNQHADEMGERIANEVIGQYLLKDQRTGLVEEAEAVRQPSRVVIDWQEGTNMEFIASTLNGLPENVGITIRLSDKDAGKEKVLESKRSELGITPSRLRIVVGNLTDIVEKELAGIEAQISADSVTQYRLAPEVKRFLDGIIMAAVRMVQPGRVNVVSMEDPLVIRHRQVEYRSITLEVLAETWMEAEKAEALVEYAA